MSAAVLDLLRALAGEFSGADRPALIGLGGAQGSGKTYQARAFAARGGFRTAQFSLDDFYLTRLERAALAARVHPLLITRGPPGSHDLPLAQRTIDSLRCTDSADIVRLPRFDKRADDRAPEAEWPVFEGGPDAILMEGWCMGALPPAPAPAPLNALEANEDRDGAWRAFTLARIEEYQEFFEQFDAFVHLQAPSFEIVRSWRLQQEEETLGRPLTEAERRALDRFIDHYERVTRSMLAGRHRARWIAHLDESRRIVSIERRT